MFPSRYRELVLEGYPDLRGLQVRVNPTQKELDTLSDSFETDEKRVALGAALVQAYAGGKAEAYGVVLDFSSPEKAIETILSDSLPGDLSYALRNAPVDIPVGERIAISKKLQAR